jgi:triosephosphate isomerase
MSNFDRDYEAAKARSAAAKIRATDSDLLLFAAGSKMNFTPSEAKAYLTKLIPLVSDVSDRELLVLPSFTALPVARDLLCSTRIRWGAQDLHPEDDGAHTGDTSGRMLTDLGCCYVMVGHPERRRDYRETDQLTSRKVAAATRWGLTPILCVGEPRRHQVLDAIKAVEVQLQALKEATLPVVVAYEPLWAIGGPESASPDWVAEVVAAARKWCTANIAQPARVVYGGSVDHAKAPELLRQAGADGLLVGNRALDPVVFAEIAHLPLPRIGRTGMG